MMLKKENQHTEMQFGNTMNANEVCPWMLGRKCLLAMLILMLVILMLILMLLNLNTGYADTDDDLCTVYQGFFRVHPFSAMFARVSNSWKIKSGKFDTILQIR